MSFEVIIVVYVLLWVVFSLLALEFKQEPGMALIIGILWPFVVGVAIRDRIREKRGKAPCSACGRVKRIDTWCTCPEAQEAERKVSEERRRALSVPDLPDDRYVKSGGPFSDRSAVKRRGRGG